IDNSKRTLHGALLDAEILADVYLAMTGGQTALAFSMEGEPNEEQKGDDIQRIVRPVRGLRVIKASAEELVAHEARL
ncbi:DNA polymerase III subunit epsilon, partial [Escherichia coli]